MEKKTNHSKLNIPFKAGSLEYRKYYYQLTKEKYKKVYQMTGKYKKKPVIFEEPLTEENLLKNNEPLIMNKQYIVFKDNVYSRMCMKHLQKKEDGWGEYFNMRDVFDKDINYENMDRRTTKNGNNYVKYYVSLKKPLPNSSK